LRPRGGSEADIQSIDNDLKYFVTTYYDKIYRGSAQRSPLCLSTISYLLDIVPLLRACGPAWVVRQFPMDRKIGTLGKLIRSSSRPHASLLKGVARKCKADLITSFGQIYLPTEWAETTKERWTAPDLSRCSLKVPQDVGPACARLPPRNKPVGLGGAELNCMRAVLIQENADEVPLQVLAKTYYRAKLAFGKTSGSKPVGSDCDKRRRRKYVVRVNSREDFFLPDGFVGERPILTFATILHYAAVFIGGQAIAFAYVQRAKSDTDRPGQYGYAATKYGTECILGLGGSCGYVPVGAVADVVSTIEREGLFFFFHREPSSEDL